MVGFGRKKSEGAYTVGVEIFPNDAEGVGCTAGELMGCTSSEGDECHVGGFAAVQCGI